MEHDVPFVSCGLLKGVHSLVNMASIGNLQFRYETHLVDFPATAELVYKRVSLVEMSREPSVLGTDSLGKTCILIRRDFVSPLSGFLGIMGSLVSFRWNFHSKYPVS